MRFVLVRTDRPGMADQREVLRRHHVRQDIDGGGMVAQDNLNIVGGRVIPLIGEQAARPLGGPAKTARRRQAEAGQILLHRGQLGA